MSANTKVTAKQTDKKKFPTEFIDLPSKGWFYPKESPLAGGQVELKYMTAREEDILTSANLIKQGKVIDVLLESLVVGDFATSNMKYAKVGALIKFTSPDTREFLNNTLVTAGTDNAEDRMWAKIGAVVNDGANSGVGNLESGLGPVTLNNIIPDGSVVSLVIPNLTTTFADDLKTDIIDRIEAYEEFGLRYDIDTETWKVITATNLSASSVFSLSNAGSTASTNLDASWWFKFTNDGNTYTVTYRSLNYLFESEAQNKFHYDAQEKIYDYKTGKSVKDTVKVLKTNSIVSTGNSIGYPINWQVVDTVTEADGYQDNRKVKVGFYDDDDDNVVDNPEIFDISSNPDIFYDGERDLLDKLDSAIRRTGKLKDYSDLAGEYDFTDLAIKYDNEFKSLTNSVNNHQAPASSTSIHK